MYTHNPHLKFLEAAENIAQLYRDDRKKNIFCTSAMTTAARHAAAVKMSKMSISGDLFWCMNIWQTSKLIIKGVQWKKLQGFDSEFTQFNQKLQASNIFSQRY